MLLRIEVGAPIPAAAYTPASRTANSRPAASCSKLKLVEQRRAPWSTLRPLFAAKGAPASQQYVRTAREQFP